MTQAGEVRYARRVPAAPHPRAFAVTTALLALLAAAPLWAFAFLPMQDLPQHLFQAQALAHAGTAQPWSDWYEVAWRPGPYASFYLLVAPLAGLLGVQGAARCFLSLAVVATAGYLWVERRSRPEAEPPWALLLLFPLGFSQTYYLGFANFVVAVPLLLFALRSHALHLAEAQAGRRRWVAHAAAVSAVFLTHPYVLIVYVAIVAARTVWLVRHRPAPWLPALPAALAGLALAAWLLVTPGPEQLPQTPPPLTAWWPPAHLAGFVALPLTSMGTPGLLGLLSVLAWVVLLGVVARAAWLARGAALPSRVEGISLGAVVLGLVALPFWLGHFSYFNARLAPIAGALAAVALARLPLRGRLRWPWIAAVAALTVIPWRAHAVVSAERESLVPLIDRMEAGSTLHAIYVDAASTALDPAYFFQLHAHDHFFALLRGRAAFTDGLFPSTMTPVQYRAGLELPFVRPGRDHSVAAVAAAYRYLLVRGARVELDAALARRYRLVARAEPWALWEAREAQPAGGRATPHP